MSSSPFSNLCIEPAALPKAERLPFSKLEPAFRRVQLLHQLLLLLGFQLLALVALQQWFWHLPGHMADIITIVMWSVAVLDSLFMFYSWHANKRKAYAVRERDLSFRSGLMFRKLVSQPLLRIQHIELKRGPLERLAGLARIQVFSAGSAMQTFQIPGLSAQTAQELRQFVLDNRELQHNV